jgi:hypothetical protein
MAMNWAAATSWVMGWAVAKGVRKLGWMVA